MTDAEWQPVLAVTIPGEPVPKGRPRFVRGRVVTPAKTREHEKRIRNIVLVSWLAGLVAKTDPERDRFKVHMAVFTRTEQQGDGDNYIKVIDGVTKAGVVWKDDRQVKEWSVSLDVDREHPRTELTVWRRVAVAAGISRSD